MSPGFFVGEVDAADKVLGHVDEQGYQLGGVDVVGRELGEVHPLLEEFVGDGAEVVDFGDGDHGVASEVGVYDDGLRVGVADDSEPLAAVEVVELILKFRAEVVALDAVDRAVEAQLGVESYQSGTFCAKMRMIVCAVEQVVDTRLFGDCSEEASHSR